MSYIRKKGEKGRYWMVDRQCIGRPCFAPGEFQHRGAILSGSRNTGQTSLCCMRNAYHGCPNDKDQLYSIEIERQHKAEGWKNA
jgi:hypothetical protein